MLKFTTDFEKREWVARQALKELKNKYASIFRYQLFFTTDQYSPFDAYFFITDNEGDIKKRVWIELKIRDTIYPNYILEKKKISSLKQEIKNGYLKEDEVTLLYINFTPDQTIIWNISKIDQNITTKLKANKATSESRTNKVNKDVIMLSPEDGRQLEYIIDEHKLINTYNKRVALMKAGVKPRKGIFG